MAFYNLEKREKSDGTIRYRCVVGIKEKGRYIHRESKTFSKASIAKAWGARRVLELESDIASPKETKAQQITISELIEKYCNHPTVNLTRSKKSSLGLVSRSALGLCDAVALKAKDVIEFGQQRLAEGVTPATVCNNVSNLAAVMNNGKILFGIDAGLSEFNDARRYMTRTGIIGQSNKRTRRPTREECDRITEELKLKEITARSGAPYSRIFLFSILTCMRIGEVCRLKWGDVDKKTKSVLVRDRKDPRKKVGNHMIVPLLGEAWEIVLEQKEVGERVFPFRSDTVTDVFDKAKQKLGIVDLHYHDLRREGASRLFEMGFSVEDVAQVTGHKNLNTLWTVYREIYPQTLHDRFEELQARRDK